MQTKSILSAEQFNKDELLDLMKLSQRIENILQNKRTIPLLKEYVLASLFFEPSTRTRLSFETAMHRLGGKVITSVGFQFSSLAKGETLFDTLKMMEAYADICVIRHNLEGASTFAAQNLTIPVINGGDGSGEHPTQAILDIYTIHKLKNLSKNKTIIAFIGDIKYGRTIHSLYKLLMHFNVEFIFVSPKALGLSEKDRKRLDDQKIHYQEIEDINQIKEADVAYVTRIQEERFSDHNEYKKYSNFYVINKKFLSKCRPDIIVMHPLPRLKEISTDIDELPNAVYFEQAQNGIYTRMAILLNSLGVEHLL